MAVKVAYDIHFITALLTGISVTPTFAYGRDQLNLQGVHTAHNRWHELLEHDRKHSNITCRAELNVGPRARERTVECNSTLDPKGLNSILVKEQFGFKCNSSTEIAIYRVSQEEQTKLREGVPYVKLYRYNPQHLYPKLNGYGDNGQRKVWTSCISTYCTSTAV